MKPELPILAAGAVAIAGGHNRYLIAVIAGLFVLGFVKRIAGR